MNTAAALLLRVMPLTLVCASAGAQLTTPQPDQKTSPVEFVDTLHKVFGDHHARAIHTKGLLLEGTFTPAASAASVTTAPHLQKQALPVILRFSNFAGVPDIPDNHPLAAPRGLAIKFKLPDGRSTDIVAHSFNGFPSANADQFRELLLALAASGPDAAKPTQLDAYLGEHPIAKAFLTTKQPTPVSYASLPYYGVNAFKFTNAQGAVSYGRYRIVPVAPAAYLSDAQNAKAAPGFLADEIRQRVKAGPVRLKLLLQIADKDDHVDDPSIAWPDSRRMVELGTLSITGAVADSATAEQSLIFTPSNLTAGIEIEDKMAEARTAAYAVSFGERQ